MLLSALLFVGGCALVLSPWDIVLRAGLLCSGLGLGCFFDARFNS
jgi:hypothetical protein